MYVLLKTRLFRLVRRWVPVNQFNHTSWMTAATPTDRCKAVRNRCVIKVFGGVFVLSIIFRIFCWHRGYCHRTESDLLFLSTFGAQASPQKGGRNQVSERVSAPCWLATPIANAPWKPPIIRWRSSTVSRSWNWWKVWSFGKSLLVKGKNVI